MAEQVVLEEAGLERYFRSRRSLVDSVVAAAALLDLIARKYYALRQDGPVELVLRHAEDA